MLVSDNVLPDTNYNSSQGTVIDGNNNNNNNNNNNKDYGATMEMITSRRK
jgi:hypothetical protein